MIYQSASANESTLQSTFRMPNGNITSKLLYDGVNVELRTFFTLRSWWGKIIGAFFGFLMAGGTGALIGLLIGNFFDRGLVHHFSGSFWYYRNEKDLTIKRIFFNALFSIMGHMAKANGHVSQASISFATRCITDMRLNKKEEKQAQLLFRSGKQRDFNLNAVLIHLHSAIYDRAELIKLFVDTQYQLSEIDGPSLQKQYIMNMILRNFNFAPLHSQHHFKDHAGYWQPNHQSSSTQSSNPTGEQTTFYTSSHPLADAYQLLEIGFDASKQEIKRAYRRLVSRHHPDKLIAKGASEAMIRAANTKTQAIRQAYEKICLSKGW